LISGSAGAGDFSFFDQAASLGLGIAAKAAEKGVGLDVEKRASANPGQAENIRRNARVGLGVLHTTGDVLTDAASATKDDHKHVSKANGKAKKRWMIGDPVYNATSKGKDPKWSTVRSRFWKNEAAASDAADKYKLENLIRMKKGLAPQRFNLAKGGIESKELSHEPIPARDGGTEFVPRWPQEHALVDKHRKPGY